MITLYSSNTKENEKNCLYPNKNEIKNIKQLKDVVSYDHVCAKFKNNYRSKDNFLECNCDVFDCDNDHSDSSNEWIYPEDYEFLFEGAAHIVVPSRNNNKEKGGKSARPRHHVYLPHKVFKSAEECELFKKQVYDKYNFFDKNALDCSRFIFGNITDEILWFGGSRTIDEILGEADKFELLEMKEHQIKIEEGNRNSTMSRIAGRIVKRFGVSDESYSMFLDQAIKCEPPLEDIELNKIWNSAVKFGKKISNQEGYIEPNEYNN